jgi:hypothetical protein
MELSLGLPLLFDSISEPWLRDTTHFARHWEVVPAFEIATLATAIAFMLPPAFFGANALEELRWKSGYVAHLVSECGAIFVLRLKPYIDSDHDCFSA